MVTSRRHDTSNKWSTHGVMIQVINGHLTGVMIQVINGHLTGVMIQVINGHLTAS